MSETGHNPDGIPLLYTIDLVLGGFKRRLTDHVIIQSNLSATEIQAAYKKGVQIVGVDCVQDVCSEYECNELPWPQWQKYMAAGICRPPFTWVGDDNPDAENGEGIDWIDADAFADLYILTVFRGDPEFRWQYPREARAEEIRIGGIGVVSMYD